MDLYFKPKRSSSPNNTSEKRSVNYIEQLLLDTETEPHLSINDKTANYDGYIELLVSDLIRGKVTVQIKTYETRYAGARKHPIPTSLLGYGQSVPTEVFMLLVVDHEEKAVYWKHISQEFILENRSKSNQETITYHFTDDEVLNRDNRDNVVERWKEIYMSLAELIAERKNKIHTIIESYAHAFEGIDSHFFNLPDSYIERKELTTIDNWIHNDLMEDNAQFNNVCIVTGDAGAGKSVIIKQLARQLKESNTSVLAIKADMRDITSEKAMDDICDVITYFSSDKTKRAVLLIDQIDALSQTLTNDRSQIMAYYGIINKFSSPTYRNLRIVVSCREFDLTYDPTLSRLTKKKIIKIGKLQKDEVKSVLKRLLGDELTASVQEKTLELLQTPQYLDTYCRVYGNHTLNFSSPLHLYEELWKIKVLHPVNGRVNPDALETTLSKIARKIQADQSLTVKWVTTGNETASIDYLSTEGIITKEEAKLRFFHQSFSDYVFARQSLSEENSLHQYLLDSSQGLFVRSTIKSSLEYLRWADEDGHVEQLQTILIDDRIRYHIKLLALQHFASVIPTARDVQLILRLKETHAELYRAFIKLSLGVAWFDGLVDEWEKDLIQLKTLEEDQTIIRRLTCFAGERLEAVFRIVDEIEDETVQTYAILDALRFVQDHKNPIVLKWYRKLNGTMDEYDLFAFLEKSIADNAPFVCVEVGRMFEKAIGQWDEKGEILTDDHHFFKDILEPLVKKCPRDIYEQLKKVTIAIINKTSTSSVSDDYLSEDTAFNGWHLSDNHYRELPEYLMLILKSELSTDIRFVKNEIRYFLSTNSNTLCRIALEVMLESPAQFADITYGLYKCHELIEHLLCNQKEGYYFKKLLKASYPYFTPDQKEQIRQKALTFISEREKATRKERLYAGQPIFPNLVGVRQRAFIHSLPEEELSLALRHKKDELERRFPWKYTNEKSSDHISMAHICGGLVSDDIYEKFSIKNWETSFLKLPNSHRRFDYHLSMDTHLKKFSECVQKNPSKFYSFVFEMFNDRRIENRFRMAGLCGLAEANYKIDNLYPLFFRLSKQATDSDRYEMVDIAQLFIKFESRYIDEISEYLLSIIKKDDFTVYDPKKENESSKDNKISDLLTKGINTIQGRAIYAFIENATFDSRRSYVYETFIELANGLSVEHRLTVLYYIYRQEVYDEKLFDKLLPVYLQHGVSEFINTFGNVINAYLSCKPEIVIPYIRSVANLARSQKGLGILCFLGTIYGVKACKDILDAKLNDDHVKFVDGAIEAAFTNFTDSSCNGLSLSVINRMIDSSSEAIIELFSYEFSKLESNDFPVVKDAFRKSISKTYKMRGAINYLEKCCAEYPKECYDCLDLVIKRSGDDEHNFEKEKHLELLFAIYKDLKGSPDVQEKIMDTFDYALISSYDNYGLHKILASITY